MRVLILLTIVTALGAAAGCGKDDKNAQAKADKMKGIILEGQEKPAPAPAPMPPPDNTGIKSNPKPKGLVQNIRAAGYRPMRQNELRQIAQFAAQFELTNNRPPRSKEEFINYMKRDSPGIAQAIEEEYYVLNLKVNMKDANSVVAFESLTDAGGHQTARVDASVGPVAVEELRKLLGE
jgi:hypothetical protein